MADDNNDNSEFVTLVRARFVYEAARLAAEAAGAPIVPAVWEERDQHFKDQFLRIIAQETGPDRISNPRMLHMSWVQAYSDMGWQYGEKYDAEAKTHPDMVPYSRLGQLEQDKDDVFVALCDIARQWIMPDSAEQRGGPDGLRARGGSPRRTRAGSRSLDREV
jgi:hypothetical protein